MSAERRTAEELRDGNGALRSELDQTKASLRETVRELEAAQAATEATAEALQAAQAQAVADKEAWREEMRKASEDGTRRLQTVQGNARARVCVSLVASGWGFLCPLYHVGCVCVCSRLC